MKQNKKIIGLFSRYFAILILGVGNFYLIYKIFTPLTIHVTNILIKIVTPTILRGDMIYFGQVIIQITPACVAASAFYLLLALIFTTANVKPKTRLYAALTALAMLFALNILRIIILASITTLPNFETIHWIFWNFVSTIFVVATYIATIKIYKIKSIPVYSDFKEISSLFRK